MSNVLLKWPTLIGLLGFLALCSCDVVASPYVLAHYSQWNIVIHPDHDRVQAHLTFHLEVNDPSEMFVGPVEMRNNTTGLIWLVDNLYFQNKVSNSTISWAITADWRDLIGYYEVRLPQRHGRETVINIHVRHMQIIEVVKIMNASANDASVQLIVYSKEHELIGTYSEENFVLTEFKQQYFYRYMFSVNLGVAIITGPFASYKNLEQEEQGDL